MVVLIYANLVKRNGPPTLNFAKQWHVSLWGDVDLDQALMLSHNKESFFVSGKDDTQHHTTTVDFDESLDTTSFVNDCNGVIMKGGVDGSIVGNRDILRISKAILMSNDSGIEEVFRVDAVTKAGIIIRK